MQPGLRRAVQAAVGGYNLRELRKGVSAEICEGAVLLRGLCEAGAELALILTSFAVIDINALFYQSVSDVFGKQFRLLGKIIISRWHAKAAHKVVTCKTIFDARHDFRIHAAIVGLSNGLEAFAQPVGKPKHVAIFKLVLVAF